MKKTIGWILGILAVLVLLAFAFGGWGWWHGGCCGWGGYGGYGGWGMGPGMMGWGYAPFGWIGMIFMALIPLGFLVLTVLGIVWLVRAVSGNFPAPAAASTCPNCGRAGQSDWQNCPYCGTALKK